MKIHEIINEAMPYGFGSYLKNKIRSSIPVGMAGNAQAQGKMQSGVTANNIFQKYHNWLGQHNGQPTADSLKQFLELNKMKSDTALAGIPSAVGLGTNQPINDKIVGAAINAAVQQQATPAVPTAPNPSGAAPAAPSGAPAPRAPAPRAPGATKIATTAIDDTISKIQQLRPRDRAKILLYAQQQLSGIKEETKN